MAPRLATISSWSSAIAILASTTAPVQVEAYKTQQYSWYKNYYPRVDQYCFEGCFNAINAITFDYKPASNDSQDWKVDRCSNTLKINSGFYCAQTYCTVAERHAGLTTLTTLCDEVGIRIPTVEEAALPESELRDILVLDHTAAHTTAETPLVVPAIPDAEWQARATRTVRTFYKAWDLGFNFSFLLALFWIAAIATGITYRVQQSTRKAADDTSSTLWLYVRRNLLFPATFGSKEAVAIGNVGTIPPRLESILFTVYVVINFMMCFPGYSVFTEHVWYPDKRVQWARYIGDRTGFLSIAQLPMVWVFASRNNPIMWLTGWSFATFTRFHRLVARICVIHAVVHSVAWTAFALLFDVYDAYKIQAYWRNGVAATVIGCFMLLASIYYLREKYYDSFLVVHIGLSVLFFVTTWYHVIIFDGEFNYFLYPCIAIWVLDRILRLKSLVLVSVMPRFFKGVKATVTCNPEMDMVRLDITDFLDNTRIAPGVYYYLYIPDGLRGYEGHPFTLCSWRRPQAANSEPLSPTEVIKEKQSDLSIRPALREYAVGGEIAHTLLVRPYKGMTGRMQRKLLSRASLGPAQQTVFLEGPYGRKLDLSTYSEVLVLCGGSGITTAVSHANFLAEKNSQTRMHIYWAVPQRELADDVCANELAAVLEAGRLNMTVHLTADAEDEEGIAEHHRGRSKHRQPYEVILGRPDIEAVMRRHRNLATRSLAILTCGPPQFSEACRAAVVKILGEEGVEVGWYNESMTW
ncbi:Ferric/cupric reductase transmembrane component 2 [Cercospora beticola]|uniref:Ferric/cupric reductase transmembrane component 2 n=1 Tax=Cercospora beticola TaxID=122368 RepID=A0A2G5HPB2_CERBT|nr:Ferric/cupric reductase transmembrane component 2 [Cercospora beticola]PIA94397.1 Ferric/cupric reductase transmembrane component 2 [Cercospora beticola]WPB05298.1 hypothetical protein RHO25_009950 [Cercospora beticola]